MSYFSEKQVLVYGLGKAGYGAVSRLLASGAQVYAWDDNQEARMTLLTQYATDGLVCADIDNLPWDELDYVVLAPGIPLTHPEPHSVAVRAKKMGIPVICDVEVLYLDVPEARYIAITGTNGKSTTTALIHHILVSAGLKAHLGGNIGQAASGLPSDPKGIYVLEMSSYQLDLIDKTHFDVSVLLNLTPDHLDRHGGMAGYVTAKKRMFLQQGKDDIAVIATDDEYTVEIARELQERVQVVSVSSEQNEPFSVGQFPRLPGRHNQQNLLAAYEVARACGVSHEQSIAAIASFEGLEHRLQYIGEVNGVAFVNDSKATNAIATQQAFNSYDEFYWIAGGVAKEGGIESLMGDVHKVIYAFLIGACAKEFAEVLGEHNVPYSIVQTLDEAVRQSYLLANGKGVVLFSPACASFDQFANFEKRGEYFCAQVNALEAAYEI